MNENNPTIGILLPPSTRGLGMIKSFPLDVAHLIAWLRNDTTHNIRLIDFRIHAINGDNFWQTKGVDLNIFNDFKRCIDHILVKEDLGIKNIAIRILKETDWRDIKYILFSVSVLEQFSLEYLMPSLCIARELKLLRPSMKIVFFGSCPQKHIKKIMNTFIFLDAFLEDGSERSVDRYMKRAKMKKAINGLSYRESGEVVFAPSHKDEINFNEFPVPDFSLFDAEKYRCRGRLVLPYEINRGCSKNCFYCYFTHKNKLFYKDIDRVIADLKTLAQRYQTNAFHFVDGAMNSDEAYLERLCAAFAQEFPDIKWSAMARPNMDYGFLKKMRAAGCVHIRWGVESGSERMLKKINKDTSPETIKVTLQNAHSLGIYNYITLLTGTEVENEDDIAQTKQLIGEIRPYIHAAQECVFGELGSFDISKLESLLDGQDAPSPVCRRRYDGLLKRYNIPREDIIETLAKRLKLTFLVVPDDFLRISNDPGSRASTTLPAPPIETASVAACFRQQLLYDDFEFFDAGILVENNKALADYFKKLSTVDREKYYEKLSDLVIRCTAHSDYFLFFVPWWTQNIDTTLKVTQKFKTVYPHSHIILYGPYCQLFSEKILNSAPHVDFVLTGEIEEFLNNLNARMRPEDIPSLAYLKNKQFHVNAKKSFVLNAQSDFLGYGGYLKFIGKYRIPKSTFLFYELSRGCKYTCFFCPQLKGAKLKYKSADFTFREIKEIVTETGIRNIYFLDSALNFDVGYLEEWLDKIIASGISIQWTAYMIAENLNLRLLRKMKRAGCLNVRYGIESANAETQSLFSKNVDLQAASRIIRQTSECGMTNQISFITGLPFEAARDRDLIIRFIHDNRAYLTVVNIYTFKVRKDTVIYKNPKKFGIKLLAETVDAHSQSIPFEEINGLDWPAKLKAQAESCALLKREIKKLDLPDIDPQVYFYRLTNGKEVPAMSAY